MKSEKFFYPAHIWQSLKRNRLAMAGLIFISILSLSAVFAYLIVPDNSRDANSQVLEIQSLRPGSHFMFLRIPAKERRAQGYIDKWFSGEENPDTYIPVSSWHVNADEMIVERYIDEDTVSTEKYSMAALGKTKPEELIETKRFFLGTDGFGRDVLSRLIIGSRVSLSVGLAGMLVSVLVGVMLGMLAGYRGGRTDAVISWFLNISWAIPTLLLVFAISMVLGKGMWQIFIAVGLTMWVNVARLVRGQVQVVKKMEYIEAARALGFSDLRILFRHILPNIAGPLIVIATANFATGVMLEAGLSFLGIGVQPPTPSWGLMIRENYNYIITGNPLPALIPGFAIMMVVLSLNMIGNGIRDAIAVKN